MATAAAIDRIVHHSVMPEFDVPSYRTPKRHMDDSYKNDGYRNLSGQNNCRSSPDQ